MLARDRHASFVSALAILGAVLERLATTIRLLQITEVDEAEEPFSDRQKGSSAMPHKRNPILCERICGIARVLRGHAMTALDNVALWHERDISHCSAERVILPDACALTAYSLRLSTRIVTGLRVKPENMRTHVDAFGGIVFSQRVLGALIVAGGVAAREAPTARCRRWPAAPATARPASASWSTATTRCARRSATSTCSARSTCRASSTTSTTRTTVSVCRRTAAMSTEPTSQRRTGARRRGRIGRRTTLMPVMTTQRPRA